MNEAFQAELQRVERYAADVYHHLTHAKPGDIDAHIAERYLANSEGAWPGGGQDEDFIADAVNLRDVHSRIHEAFYDALRNPEARESLLEASEALHRAGVVSCGTSCSRGMVKIKGCRYVLQRLELKWGWTLRIIGLCSAGRVSKTIRENPEIYAIVIKIANVFEAWLIGDVASLVFVRPTVVDIRPVIRAVRRIAETYGCTTFETTIPLEWVSRLWVTQEHTD